MIEGGIDHFPLESLGAGSGESIRFWFLCLVGLVIGLVIYKMMTDASARRPQFQTLGTYRPPAAIAVGLIPLLLLVPLAYQECWAPFRGLEIRDDSLVLVRHFPERELHLQRDDVERVLAYRDRSGYRLAVVEATDRHESALTSQEKAKRLRDRIEDWRRQR